MSDKFNSNTRYKLYLNSCIELAETIVIKSSSVATAMNDAVVSKLGLNSVDEINKTTWKYYQNISGKYHLSDKLMKIRSLDVDQEIDFTVENLKTNTNTSRAYTFGSRYYRELVSLYPDQELLILGIINPADIQTAINSKDGTILTYPKRLVEENEYSLMINLQKWIYNYLFRWVNTQYSISDNLYVATYIGQLYLHLVQAILTFRLSACKTNEAHSYHVQQYLASHGLLDSYLSTMTKEQALFFYRNIRYIERNAGKRDTFSWLTDKTMTIRGFPLYEFILNHDLTNLGRETTNTDSVTGKVTKTKQVIGDLTFKRTPINSPATQAKLTNLDLDSVLKEIEPLAINNATHNDDEKDTITKDLTYSNSSVIGTKTLQSVVTNRIGSVVYTLESILLNHWLYLVGKEKYKAPVFIKLPINGSNLNLTAQQAVGLFLYTTHKYYIPSYNNNNLESLKIPNIRLHRVTRVPTPSRQDLRAMSSSNDFSDEKVNRIYDTKVDISNLLSNVDFRNICNSIFEKSNLQYALYATEESMTERAYAQATVARLYCDETVSLNKLVNADNSKMTYSNLLDSIGLDLGDYSPKDLLDLANAIYSAAAQTQDNDNTSLDSIQESMVSLLEQLSSYSIQVARSINKSPIVIVPNPAIRIGRVNKNSSFVNYVNSATLRVYDESVKVSELINVTSKDLLESGDLTFTSNSLASLEIKVKPRPIESPIDIYVGYLNPQLDHSTSFASSEQAFNALTQVQKDDIFNSNILN